MILLLLIQFLKMLLKPTICPLIVILFMILGLI